MISFPADIAAEPLLYDTTQCDDCPRRPVCFQWGRVCWWHFQKRVGTPYAHSGLGHASIGCYMVQGIHIALDGIGVWKIKHGLLAGIRYIQRHRRMGQKPSQLLVYILEGTAILSGLAAAIMKSTLE